MEFVTLEDVIFILLLLFLLSSAINYWLVATPSSCMKKEPSSGRDLSCKRRNKSFLRLALLLVGARIVLGILNANDTSPKSETKTSLRGSDFAQKLEHVSQITIQDPLTLLPVSISDDTYVADENEDEDDDPCSVLLSERRENDWTEDIGTFV